LYAVSRCHQGAQHRRLVVGRGVVVVVVVVLRVVVVVRRVVVLGGAGVVVGRTVVVVVVGGGVVVVVVIVDEAASGNAVSVVGAGSATGTGSGTFVARKISTAQPNAPAEASQTSSRSSRRLSPPGGVGSNGSIAAGAYAQPRIPPRRTRR
jgi:hypothetical protein